jgi:hypothetical protein
MASGSGQAEEKTKMRKQLAIVLALLLIVVVAAPVSAGGRPFFTTLTGAAEAPGPGDPDGSGTAFITLNQGQEEVCFDIEVSGVAPITAAHIHVAPEGSPGPVVVSFDVPVNGLNGCVSADADLIKDIRQSPSEYYVNVHNAEFPAGALRGQLSK